MPVAVDGRIERVQSGEMEKIETMYDFLVPPARNFYNRHRGTYICKWCFDAGCLACESEIVKYEKGVTERIRTWQPPSEKMVQAIIAIASSFQPPLSAEDKKLFIAACQLPPKLFVAERGSDADMEALKRVFGYNALQTTFANGVTPEAMEAIYKNAERERIAQRLRKMRHVPRVKATVWQ